MKFPILIGALALLLTNCTTKTKYEKIIQNNSSHDIWLIHDQMANYCMTTLAFDSILVPRNTNLAIVSVSSAGVDVDHFSDCNFMCNDSLDTRIDTHDSLKLNFTINTKTPRWLYSVSIQDGAARECECRLTITDADIN